MMRLVSQSQICVSQSSNSGNDVEAYIQGPNTKETREITKAQFIQALEINGYDQGFGHMVESNDPDTLIINACAYGQAMLNLGGWSLHPDETTWPDSTTLREVTHMNDKKKTIKQIVRFLKREWKNQMDDKLIMQIHDWGKYENYSGVKVQ